MSVNKRIALRDDVYSDFLKIISADKKGKTELGDVVSLYFDKAKDTIDIPVQVIKLINLIFKNAKELGVDKQETEKAVCDLLKKFLKDMFE